MNGISFIIGGIIISLAYGGIVTSYMRNKLRHKLMSRFTRDDYEFLDRYYLGWNENPSAGGKPIGYVERLFFSTFVTLSPISAGTSMIIWLGLKMAINWKRHEAHKYLFNKDDSNDKYDNSQKQWITEHLDQSFAMISLNSGLLSLTFAFIGGLVIRYGFFIIFKINISNFIVK